MNAKSHGGAGSPGAATRCDDYRPSATRWIGWQPRVPLAISEKAAIRSAGQACCAVWAKLGSRWRAIDAWGQVLGSAEVVAREAYDVTGCLELELAPREVGRQAVLFASERGDWVPSPPVQWQPSAVERATLDVLVEAAEGLYLDDGVKPSHLDKGKVQERRHVYFRLPAAEDVPDLPTRFAVIDGPFLAITYLGSKNRWFLAHVDTSIDLRWAISNPYTMLAVFDMDGDGYPEVVYQRSEGVSWTDVVLRGQPNARTTWTEVAEGIGGARL